MSSSGVGGLPEDVLDVEVLDLVVVHGLDGGHAFLGPAPDIKLVLVGFRDS